MFGKLDFPYLLKALRYLSGMRVVMGAFLLFCIIVCTKSLHAETPESNDESPTTETHEPNDVPPPQPAEEPPEPPPKKRQGPRLVIHATANRARTAFAPRPPAPPAPVRPAPPPSQPPAGPQPGQPPDKGPAPKQSGEPSDTPPDEPRQTPPTETDERGDVSRHAAPVSGISAGDEPSRYSFWTTAMAADMESFETDEDYSGATYMMLVGADHKITENFLGGVSLGYEYIHLDADASGDTFQSRGFTLTPYMAIVLSDNLAFDALFSYTVLSNEVKEVSEDAGTAFGNYTSQRTMISANMNYYMLKDGWNLSAVAGYMYVNEDQEAYRLTDEDTDIVDEATSYVGEWRFGLRAGYFFQGAFEPYLEGAYLYDNTWNDDSEDRDEIEGGIGFNYYPSDRFICSLTVAHSFLRDDSRNTRVMFNLRFEF
ncbi:autotransporter outer membrane beta-barrel domain-containing protein [Desulfococcaceae bacterium HSG7]|nr:autotransporter outer membrane beta-barrel domain-containing protein [Desulfococcaceae bacterium HSG7]